MSRRISQVRRRRRRTSRTRKEDGQIMKLVCIVFFYFIGYFEFPFHGRGQIYMSRFVALQTLISSVLVRFHHPHLAAWLILIAHLSMPMRTSRTSRLRISCLPLRDLDSDSNANTNAMLGWRERSESPHASNFSHALSVCIDMLLSMRLSQNRFLKRMWNSIGSSRHPNLACMVIFCARRSFSHAGLSFMITPCRFAVRDMLVY
jgi:hypothetical protein